MARVAALSGAAILDTSWLLELYRVPRNFKESRTEPVRTETEEFVASGGELFVTVPVLFEVASHIAHVRDGRRRRTLAERLRDDIRDSVDRESPWTVVTDRATVGLDILLRSEDVVQLAERFLESSGPGYSIADISVIDLSIRLRRSGKLVKILAFDKQLSAYSD